MSLARALAQRWGATLDGDVLAATIDGAPLRARVTEGALVEVVVDAPDVAGFTLAIEPRDPQGDPDDHLAWASLAEYVRYRAARTVGVREAFLRRFAISGSDRGLVRLWLDDLTRDALLAAPERYTLAGGALTIAPFAAIGLDGFERTMRAAARLVTRPHRLADAWREALAPIAPAVVPDAWSTRGFTIAIGDAKIDTPWRADADDGDRLRTRIRVERRGARDRFALWRPTLDGADLPPPDDVAAPPVSLADRYAASGAAHRLAPVASRISTAAPDAVIADAHDVALWWRGLILDPRRLAPAIALASALANDPDSPYR